MPPFKVASFRHLYATAFLLQPPRLSVPFSLIWLAAWSLTNVLRHFPRRATSENVSSRKIALLIFETPNFSVSKQDLSSHILNIWFCDAFVQNTDDMWYYWQYLMFPQQRILVAHNLLINFFLAPGRAAAASVCCEEISESNLWSGDHKYGRPHDVSWYHIYEFLYQV